MRDAAVKAKRSAHKTTGVRWWQVLSAAVPVTLVASAWGVVVTAAPPSEPVDAKVDKQSPGDGSDESVAIPDVPTDAFDNPNAGKVRKNQSKLPALTDVKKKNITPAAMRSSPLPTPALDAYHDAAKVMSDVKAACKLDWTLVAAIGRVESDHGQYSGSSIDATGVARPEIIGVPLDGSGNTAEIKDTDNGTLDSDGRWDRAVGPMQFIPSTWKLVGVDGDGDGEKNPHNIYDAALATSVYLCASGEDLSTRAGASEAVFSYNHSRDYVATVLAIADAYNHGDFDEVPVMPAPDAETAPETDVFDPRTNDDDGDSGLTGSRPTAGDRDQKLKSKKTRPRASKSTEETLRPVQTDPRPGKTDKSDKPQQNEPGNKPHNAPSKPVEPARPDRDDKLLDPVQVGPQGFGGQPVDPKGTPKSEKMQGSVQHPTEPKKQKSKKQSGPRDDTKLRTVRKTTQGLGGQQPGPGTGKNDKPQDTRPTQQLEDRSEQAKPKQSGGAKPKPSGEANQSDKTPDPGINLRPNKNPKADTGQTTQQPNKPPNNDKTTDKPKNQQAPKANTGQTPQKPKNQSSQTKPNQSGNKNQSDKTPDPGINLRPNNKTEADTGQTTQQQGTTPDKKKAPDKGETDKPKNTNKPKNQPSQSKPNKSGDKDEADKGNPAGTPKDQQAPKADTGQTSQQPKNQPSQTKPNQSGNKDPKNTQSDKNPDPGVNLRPNKNPKADTRTTPKKPQNQQPRQPKPEKPDTSSAPKKQSQKKPSEPHRDKGGALKPRHKSNGPHAKRRGRTAAASSEPCMDAAVGACDKGIVWRVLSAAPFGRWIGNDTQRL